VQLKKAVKRKNNVKIIGKVMRVWSGPTKIGTMGFIDLADESSQQIVLVWPQSWERYTETFKEGDICEGEIGLTKDRTLCLDVNRGHFLRKINV
jgi:DNA polymerase III alpha subunit